MLAVGSLAPKDHRHKPGTPNPIHRLHDERVTFAYNLDDGFGEVDDPLLGVVGDPFEELQVKAVLFVVEDQLLVQGYTCGQLLLQQQVSRLRQHFCNIVRIIMMANKLAFSMLRHQHYMLPQTHYMMPQT